MRPAIIGRRLGAALYDALIVAALWMLIYYPLIAWGVIGGTLDDNRDPRHWLLRGAIAFLYFAWCWTRGGRTLGLLSWKLELVRDDGAAIGLRDAAARFAVASLYLLPWALLEAVYALDAPASAYYLLLFGPFLLGTPWALHERVLRTRVVALSAPR